MALRSTGRLQDALWDLLIGHTAGDGTFFEGKLAELPWERTSTVINDIVDVVLLNYPELADCEARLEAERKNSDARVDNLLAKVRDQQHELQRLNTTVGSLRAANRHTPKR